MTDMLRPWYWAVLEIDADSDERAVKRAYSRQLKSTRPDDDADAFQRLRTAYEHALLALRDRADMTMETQEAPDMPDAGLQHVASTALLREKVAIVPAPAVVLPVQRDGRHIPAVSADALARAAWADFLVSYTPRRLASLDALYADERLERFDARDAFELLALRHTADDACPADLRIGLVELFDWRDSGTSLLRRYPALAYATFNLHAMDMAWGNLLHQAQTDPLLLYLVQDAVPEKLPQRWNSDFVHAMRDKLAAIRRYEPDLLAHRINLDVFNWWEAQVADKKYFLQTAGWSSVAGLGLWGLTMMVMLTLGSIMPSQAAIAFVLCQLITVGTTAWATLRPPEKIVRWFIGLQVRWIGQPLVDKRHVRNWQIGWIPPFIILALALALLAPNQHPAVAAGAVAAGLTACAGMAIVMTSLAITRMRFCIAFAMALIPALVASQVQAQAHVLPWSAMCFGLCVWTIFLTPGEPLYRSFGWNDNVLRLLREGWIALGILLFLGSVYKLAPDWHAPLMVVLLVSGVMIARFNAGVRAVVFATFTTGPIMLAASLGTDGVQQMLAPALVLVGFFAVTHLTSE
jgi:hypothetical protein